MYRSVILNESQKLFEVMARELTNEIIENIILKFIINNRNQYYYASKPSETR